jgi:hypothetical protein
MLYFFKIHPGDEINWYRHESISVGLPFGVLALSPAQSQQLCFHPVEAAMY